MKLNKYLLAASVLVLNTLFVPIVSATTLEETKIAPISEAIEKGTEPETLLEENPLLDKGTIQSSNQATTSKEKTTQTSEENKTNASISETHGTEEENTEKETSSTDTTDSESDSNDLNHENKMTEESVEKEASVEKTTNKGISSEVIDVADWEDFITAFSNPECKKINITANIETPTNPQVNGLTTGNTNNINAAARYVYLNKSRISRKLIVEGNGHVFDFKSVCLCFNSTTHNPESPWDIELKDLTIYHGNYYGPLTFRDLGGAYEKTTKLTYNNIYNEGNQLTHSEKGNIVFKNKVSSIQKPEYTSPFGTWKINSLIQTNLFVADVVLEENADVTMSTINAGNIELCYETAGNFLMKKNSRINLTANGTDRNGYEAWGLNLLNWDGNITMENGAEMNLVPQDNSGAICMYRKPGSKFTIDSNSSVNIRPRARTSTSTNYHLDTLVYLTNNTELLIKSFGSLNILETTPNNSPTNMISTADQANLIVEKDGVLDLRSNSSNASRNLIYLGGSACKFQFSNAQKVNLQNLQKNITNNSLLSMARGSLNVNVQKVSLWNKNNLTDTADNVWDSVFNLQIAYNYGTPTIKNVDTVSLEDKERFYSNFTTQNVQRVLFEKIPDVEVTLNEPLYDTSREISGRATPNSYIYFEGINVVGKIDSPIVGDSKKYHVMTDKEGNYRFELPENINLEVGKTITAETFLNGQTAQASTVVQKNPNPEPINPNIPSEDVDNTKPDQISLFGIAYMPKQFQIPKTELEDSGIQTIAFDKTDRFDIGVRDQRNTTGTWTLKAQLHWTSGKELPGSYIQTTNSEGTVMKNINNGTDSFNPATDLTSSSNEVTGISNVKITSESLTPIIQTASNVAHNAVYNYNLGNVSLKIPNIQSIKPGVYEGFVEWNLSDTLQ